MLVAFIAVDVMLDKLVTGSHRLEYKSILFKSHLYSEPLQGELRHSDVTRSLLEADTIAPQSTKHLKRKKRHEVPVDICRVGEGRGRGKGNGRGSVVANRVYRGTIGN